MKKNGVWPVLALADGKGTETDQCGRRGPLIVDRLTENIVLLLDRADNVINVCEMKYFAGPYAIDNAADADFEQKLETFRAVTKTEKAIHLTLVTSRGLVRNAYANSVQSEVTLDDLFRA